MINMKIWIECFFKLWKLTTLQRRKKLVWQNCQIWYLKNKFIMLIFYDPLILKNQLPNYILLFLPLYSTSMIHLSTNIPFVGVRVINSLIKLLRKIQLIYTVGSCVLAVSINAVKIAHVPSIDKHRRILVRDNFTLSCGTTQYKLRDLTQL